MAVHQWPEKVQLKEGVKNNYYARLHTRSYHRCGETHLNSRPDMNC